MIVLSGIDPIRRRIHLTDVEGASIGCEDADKVGELMSQLGVRGFAVECNGNGAFQEDHLTHEWGIDGGYIQYNAVFAHSTESAGLVGEYAAIALATSGCMYPEALMQVRVALYELCHNSFDHGHPDAEPAILQLCIRLGPDRIEGWIQDQCQAFDPLANREKTIQEQIESGSRRGYGLSMVKRFLDELSHEYNEIGNHISFVKRIGS